MELRFNKDKGSRYIGTTGGYNYATRIDEQENYGDADKVEDAINKYVKFPSFAAEAADKVVTACGTMSIPEGTDRVTLWNWMGKDDPVADDYMADDTGWVKETDAKKQPKVNGDQVTCVVSNLNGSTWQKLEIKVRTTPEFMAAAIADAKGEQKFCTPNGDGTFNVNPNNGEATMELSRSLDGKKQGTLATGAAAAANAWIVELPEFAFTVSAVNRSYNGASTNVTVSVTDKESHEELETSLYKLAYSTDGGTTWTTNTVADFYAAFKDVVDTTVAVKVVITGDDTYKPSDDSQSATLKITPLDITVTAQNAEKTYGSSDPTSFAVDFDVSAAIAIGEGTSVSNELKKGLLERAAGEDAGTYDITNNLSKAYSAGGNYTVTFKKGTFTINPAQIKGFHFSDTKGYGAATAPAVLAENIDCYVEDLPAGGTNITVKLFKAFGTDTFTPNNLNENRIEVGVYTNWCTVSGGDNYLSTNVCAEIIIRKREPEVAGDTPVANETEIKGMLLGIAKGIANAKNPKPVYAEAQLTIDNATGSGDETEIKNKFLEEKKTGNVENVQSASYDIKLEYTEDYKDPKNWEDIGSSNNKKIKIVLDCPLVKTAEKVEVWRKHNGAISKAKWTDGDTATVDKSKGQVTINASKFSVYTVITYSIPPPPPSKGCDWNPEPEEVEGTAWVYSWKFSGKTSIGAKTEIAGTPGMVSACDWNPGTDAQGEVIRVAGALAIKGYTYLCEPECSMESFNMFKDAAWTFGHKGWSFYMTKPYKDIVAAEINDAVANVIGREGGKFELEGTATFVSPNLPAEEFDLTFAGFGKYNAGKKRVTSVSGKFAGTAKQPYYVPSAAEIKKAKRNLCAPAIVWDCAADSWIDDDTSVAYGNFSVKLDEAASKKFYKDGSVVQLPDWAEALIKKQN